MVFADHHMVMIKARQLNDPAPSLGWGGPLPKMIIVDGVLREARVRGVQLIPGGHRILLEVGPRELAFWQEMTASKRSFHVETSVHAPDLVVSDTNLESLQGIYMADLLPGKVSDPLYVRLTAANPPRPVERTAGTSD